MCTHNNTPGIKKRNHIYKTTKYNNNIIKGGKEISPDYRFLSDRYRAILYTRVYKHDQRATGHDLDLYQGRNRALIRKGHSKNTEQDEKKRSP